MKGQDCKRVGAIMSIKGSDKSINVIGYGTLLGEEIPPMNVNKFLHMAGVTNPKIKLDDGSIVWGCECWWGRECEINEVIQHYQKQGYKTKKVTIRSPEHEETKTTKQS